MDHDPLSCVKSLIELIRAGDFGAEFVKHTLHLALWLAQTIWKPDEKQVVFASAESTSALYSASCELHEAVLNEPPPKLLSGGVIGSGLIIRLLLPVLEALIKKHFS